MEFMYIIIAILAIGIECSSKINTNNLIRKGALLCIVVGAILEIGNTSNHLIEFGSLLYILLDNIPKLVDLSHIKQYLKHRG